MTFYEKIIDFETSPAGRALKIVVGLGMIAYGVTHLKK